MTLHPAWQELYRAALLELCPDALGQRIDDAEKAIRQRKAELRRGDSGFGEESRALDDALRGLRGLAGAECQAARSTTSAFTQSDVKS